MSELGAETIRGVSWPSNGLTEIPFRVYTDPDQYALEQERIFKGPTWSFLCLAAEIANPGEYIATTVGEAAVIVARDASGKVNALVNNCAHRGTRSAFASSAVPISRASRQSNPKSRCPATASAPAVTNVPATPSQVIAAMFSRNRGHPRSMPPLKRMAQSTPSGRCSSQAMMPALPPFFEKPTPRTSRQTESQPRPTCESSRRDR